METSLEITLYERPGCHLCEDMRDQLAALQEQWSFTVRHVNILDDIEAHTRWWRWIPVVEIGDTTLRWPIQPARLEATLLRSLQTAPDQ